MSPGFPISFIQILTTFLQNSYSRGPSYLKHASKLLDLCIKRDDSVLMISKVHLLLSLHQTVAILMQNKERAADIGRAQRRVLKPHVAREMARMSAEKREHFEKRVYEAVEEIVYAAKRRFIRLQELLDATGIFHPEANAHRLVGAPLYYFCVAK